MFGEHCQELAALWCVRSEDGQERPDELRQDTMAVHHVRRIDLLGRPGTARPRGTRLDESRQSGRGRRLDQRLFLMGNPLGHVPQTPHLPGHPPLTPLQVRRTRHLGTPTANYEDSVPSFATSSNSATGNRPRPGTPTPNRSAPNTAPLHPRRWNPPTKRMSRRHKPVTTRPTHTHTHAANSQKPTSEDVGLRLGALRITPRYRRQYTCLLLRLTRNRIVDH